MTDALDEIIDRLTPHYMPEECDGKCPNSQAKRQILAWAEELVPAEQHEMDGAGKSGDGDILHAIGYEKGYNAAIQEMKGRLK